MLVLKAFQKNMTSRQVETPFDVGSEGFLRGEGLHDSSALDKLGRCVISRNDLLRNSCYTNPTRSVPRSSSEEWDETFPLPSPEGIDPRVVHLPLY
jgi:hypothetical protein